jgi:monoamine oxidase
MPRREQHDVLVIGGGVSGLTAAIELATHGADVRVVEARSRLGGRIATDDVAGLSVETGGEFLDAVDTPFARLLGALDVELEPAVHEKQPERGAVVLGGRHVRPSAHALDLVAALDAEIERVAGSLDPEHPWEAERADALDATSLAGWVEQQGGAADTLALVEAMYAVGGSTVPTAQMSLLAMAAKQTRRGPPAGRLSRRIAGGAAAFAIAAGERLEHRVLLDAPVLGLEHGSDGVALELRDGRRLRARVAIVAVPLGPSRGLAISPLPQQERLAALAALRTGHVVKAHVAFATPWWRESATAFLPAISDSACGAVYEGPIGHPGAALTCFVGALPAMRLLQLPAPDRVAAILEALEVAAGRAFPEPALGMRIDCWNEQPETAGSYLVLRTGELTTHRDALRRPTGRVVYAGAEASSSPSFIAGAAEAGARAASLARELL